MEKNESNFNLDLFEMQFKWTLYLENIIMKQIHF